jgi:hypothetical protein
MGSDASKLELTRLLTQLYVFCVALDYFFRIQLKNFCILLQEILQVYERGEVIQLIVF